MICDHNICRECCIDSCIHNKNKIRHSFFSVDCTICGLSTVLDREENTEIIFEVERRTKLNQINFNDSHNVSNSNINQNSSRLSNTNQNKINSNNRDFTKEFDENYYKNSSLKYTSLSPLDLPLKANQALNDNPADYNQNSNDHNINYQTDKYLSDIKPLNNYQHNNKHDLNSTWSARINPKQAQCLQHPDELLNYYCFDDNCMVCAECIISGEYRNKNCLKLSKAFPTIKSRLNELLELNGNAVRQIETLKTKTSEQISNITSQAEISKNKLIERINLLKDKLDSMFYNFVSGLKDKVNIDKANLEANLRDYENRQISIRNGSNELQKIYHDSDDVDTIEYFIKNYDYQKNQAIQTQDEVNRLENHNNQFNKPINQDKVNIFYNNLDKIHEALNVLSVNSQEMDQETGIMSDQIQRDSTLKRDTKVGDLLNFNNYNGMSNPQQLNNLSDQNAEQKYVNNQINTLRSDNRDIQFANEPSPVVVNAQPDSRQNNSNLILKDDNAASKIKMSQSNDDMMIINNAKNIINKTENNMQNINNNTMPKSFRDASNSFLSKNINKKENLKLQELQNNSLKNPKIIDDQEKENLSKQIKIYQTIEQERQELSEARVNAELKESSSIERNPKWAPEETPRWIQFKERMKKLKGQI